MNRSEVTEEDYALMRRAAFDSVLPLRRDVLLALMKGQKPHSLGHPESTVSRTLQDLQACGLVKTVKVAAAGVGHHTYSLTDEARALLLAAGDDVASS
jgi:hypothetical protein